VRHDVIRPTRIAWTLVLVVLGLALASTVARLILDHVGPDRYRGLMEITRRFDLDHEINIPTWFSSTILLMAALLLGVIATVKKHASCRFALHWALLAVVFAYLSLDEAANLHEILIVPLRRRFGAHGLLYFTWVIPAGILVAALGLAYLKFLAALDRRTRWLFLSSAGLYVGGAIGMEMIGGSFAEWYGLDSLRYLVAMTLEESLEMAGIVLFLYTLLTYLCDQVGSLHIRFEGQTPVLQECKHRRQSC